MIKYKTFVVAFLALFTWTSYAYAETEFDFSGMVRLRPEMRDKKFFGSKDQESAFIGNRIRLNVKANVNEDVFAFITIQDVRQWGEESHVQTSKEKQSLDLYEAYFQVNNISGSPLSVKAGRQMLVYGDQRLLGHLGWVDQARTHDALKVMLNFGMVNVDLIASKEAETGKPSDDKNDDDILGAYAVAKIAEGVSLDVYALNWKTSGEDADGNRIKGKNIMTYGARAKAVLGAFDATGEAVFQSGDWKEGVDHSASAFSIKAGFKPGVMGSRIGFEYNHGSGDDAGSISSDGDHKTFVFPFHTNHAHYGYMDYFSWGNLDHIKIALSAKPAQGFVIKLDYHIFKLAEGKGDWLNVVGNVAERPAVEGKDSTDAGSEIDLTVVFKAMKNLKIVGGYSMFQPGDAAKERSGGHDDQSTWSYLMTIFKF